MPNKIYGCETTQPKREIPAIIAKMQLLQKCNNCKWLHDYIRSFCFHKTKCVKIAENQTSNCSHKGKSGDQMRTKATIQPITMVQKDLQKRFFTLQKKLITSKS